VIRREFVEIKGGNRAMVVDDSRAMRMILRKTLTQIGYDVCDAGNGAEAMALLEKGESGLSLMLVDWNMPVMCGLDLVKAVRSNERYSTITMIMVTTETEIQHISDALEAGASEYVMKPFTSDALQDKLVTLNLVQ
jgi:two-component system, chemotaxis family, chemotaxis protein CheY